MDWVTAANVGSPIAALVIGGLFTRKKTKADSHSVVVADAVAVSQKASEQADKANARAEDALRRIDEMENRENARDELARQHIRWDWKLMRQLHDLGIEVPDPPSLFLYDNPTKGN